MPKISCTTLSPRRNIGDQLTIVPMSAVSVVQRRLGGVNVTRIS